MATLIQMGTSTLDLAGVLLIGVVAAMSISVVEDQPPPPFVSETFASLGSPSLSAESQIAILAVLAGAVLLAKSFLSPLLMARILKFLAGREALIAAGLARELFSRPLVFIQQRSSQETAYCLIQGVTQVTIVLLGQSVVVVSELALLLLLGGLLMLVNPPVALATIFFFATVAFGLQQILARRMTKYSSMRVAGEIQALNAVQEAIGTYREITVSDRRDQYVQRFQGLRQQVATSIAGTTFTGLIPKFALEATLVMGGFLMTGFLVATQPLATAVGMLALFLAASTRVIPALLRLQSAALSSRGAAASATRTFQLAEALGNPRAVVSPAPNLNEVRARIRRAHLDFAPELNLEKITFSYGLEREPAVSGISISVAAGQSLAIVGRSGAGKSTLADLILGVLTPQYGQVRVGGVAPDEAVRRWPGAIAYVPQAVLIANDSVRANVALGLPRDAIDDVLVWEALRQAHLADYIRSDVGGLDAEIGEHGFRLSGGQRQRLGIARALFTGPKLLVLDEATSSMDAETELAISGMLSILGTTMTTVVIAHRLSTVRDADTVVYLDAGKMAASGSFAEVCEQVPALRRQAELMGLAPVSTAAVEREGR